ncbi:hypothetical protein SADUNF_Sadunf16G0187700 [Salix dunnii]|uniref:GDSL esterase/lipase n=1 Tax=Salix dunnii TaxID=1413687 RepID=A0A835JAH2_9ROSI|nr:hypothetical protein SADUNF_Sadunf16G0187700 [Salix dunnii]
MAYKIKTWYAILVLLKFVSQLQNCAHAAPQVPCFFIFGDSLADNGNNNHLATNAKANYHPFGIDFLNRTDTGRFTNGRTTVDLIGRDILIGVNYASGGAGIRDETGKQLGGRISLNRQLQNHKVTFSSLIKLLGTRELVANYLNKCLYSVAMGSNDYLNNYFVPGYYKTSRRIALPGLGPLGSIPYAFSNICRDNVATIVANINSATQIFYATLVLLVDRLNRDLKDAHFIYLNRSGISSRDPSVLGFKVVDVGCCPIRSDGQCIPNSNPCKNRTEYVFWDVFHPTEALNQFTATRSYSASLPSDAYPYDISHLVKIEL